MTPEQNAVRVAAIRRAWDDPLLRATHNQHLRNPEAPAQRQDAAGYMRWYRKVKTEDYNAWHREYRARTKKPRTDEERALNRECSRRRRAKLKLAATARERA